MGKNKTQQPLSRVIGQPLSYILTLPIAVLLNSYGPQSLQTFASTVRYTTWFR